MYYYVCGEAVGVVLYAYFYYTHILLTRYDIEHRRPRYSIFLPVPKAEEAAVKCDDTATQL